jgi:hypothetical protein
MATTLIARKLESNDGATRFICDTTLDQELMIAVPPLKDLKMVITVPRNLKFHKKFFVMLGVIYDYMDVLTREQLNVHSTEELLNRLKIDLGLYSLYIMGPGSVLPEGTPVFKPDSISFDKMDDTAFARLYKGAIGVAINKYVSGQDEVSMMRAVDGVLRFE